MKHLTPPTRTFVLLVLVVLAATYGALLLLRQQSRILTTSEQKNQAMQANADQNEPKEQILSTKGWKEYKDQSYPLKFKYPATWDISTDSSIPGYYAVELTADDDQGTMKVYVSKLDYFAMKGLETKSYSLNGKHGQVLGDWVYAVKEGDYYYTFDSTEASKPLPELRTILATAVLK